MDYFFDTYAIIESLKGNPNYEKYLEATFVTTTLNLSEFYFYLLSHFDETTSDEIIKKFNFSFLEVDAGTAREAAKFRKKHYRRELSYIDCVGYVLAKSAGLKFLTGDDFFKGTENTEFVK